MLSEAGIPDTDSLLRLVSNGDQQAVDGLLQRHRDRLSQMVKSRLDESLSARIDASDVVQETLIEAARLLPKYSVSRPIAFYPWLRQIAWNKMIDLYRKHKGTSKRSVDRELDAVANLSGTAARDLTRNLISRELDPVQEVANRESVAALWTALRSLHPTDLEIIVLRHVEMLSVAETADVLDIPVGTVKSRHYRAITRLRETARLRESHGEHHPGVD